MGGLTEAPIEGQIERRGVKKSKKKGCDNVN